MNKNNETSTIISNDVLRGKPYLDIDRVITEEKSNHSTHEKNDDR
ncbi:hypothetical protein SAMN05443253_104313 [Bacillus sp. OK048]|nr:hypothetical protein SAMN05443253_104313 [Bacillus sp. OK048]